MTDSLIPRASSIFQHSLCPGSFLAQMGMVEAVDNDEAAASGTLIHAHLERHYSGSDDEHEPLDPHQQEVFDRCVQVVDNLIEKHGGVAHLFTEKQIILNLGNDSLISGHPDLVILMEDGSLHTFDYKTGYLEVSRAAANLQLWVYVLESLTEFFGEAKSERGFEALYERLDGPLFGHIIQPMVKGGTTATEITRAEIGPMMQRLKSIARGATRGKPKRTPGVSQCRYCLARGTDSCPESSRLIDNLPSTLNSEMTPAQASKVLTACAVAKKIVEATETHAKGILKADINGIPDWTLRDTGKTRTVTGIWAAFAELKEIGISEQEFLQTLSFSFKKMSDLLYEKHEIAGIVVKRRTHEEPLKKDEFEDLVAQADAVICGLGN